MTLTTTTVAGLGTAYADAQAGDLIPVERSGVMGRQTREQFQTGLGLGTISTQAATAVNIDGGNIDGTAIGAATPSSGAFTTVDATTRLRCTAAIPIFELAETDAGNSTHNRNRISRDANIFRISTVADNGTNVANDYQITLGASGATEHSWSVAGVERLRQTSNTLRTNHLLPLATGWNIGADNPGIGQNIIRFANIYLENAPNVSSDARLKENIRDLNEAERGAASKIKVRTFTMKEGGQRKIGYIAQEIIEAMASEGLCAFEYGLVSDGETYGVDYDAVTAFRSA